VVPMVTPFTDSGDIDLVAAEKIVEHIAQSGACPFALGTTGETVSIRASAKTEFVETVVKKTACRTLTYAGIIDNCMATSVEMAEQFFEAGVDMVVACVPSYYPLTGEDIMNYFENLAKHIPGPLMLYNIPITTGVSIPLEVFDKLSHLPKIIGLKDTVRDIDRIKQAAELWKDREDFSYLCGSTPLSMTALAAGADGTDLNRTHATSSQVLARCLSSSWQTCAYWSRLSGYRMANRIPPHNRAAGMGPITTRMPSRALAGCWVALGT